MKKKIICLIIWVLLTACFFWYLEDSGRRTGAKVQDTIEYYATKYDDNATPTAENVAKVLTWDSMYKQFYNLSDWLKNEMLYMALTLVVYVSGTILCYHFALVHKGKIKEKQKDN